MVRSAGSGRVQAGSAARCWRAPAGDRQARIGVLWSQAHLADLVSSTRTAVTITLSAPGPSSSLSTRLIDEPALTATCIVRRPLACPGEPLPHCLSVVAVASNTSNTTVRAVRGTHAAIPGPRPPWAESGGHCCPPATGAAGCRGARGGRGSVRDEGRNRTLALAAGWLRLLNPGAVAAMFGFTARRGALHHRPGWGYR